VSWPTKTRKLTCDVAQTLNNLGVLDRDQNRFEEAGKEHEEALKIRRQLTLKDPEAYLPDLAETLNNLGALDRSQKQTEDARKELDEALQIRRRLVQKNPEAYLPDTARSFVTSWLIGSTSFKSSTVSP
jgi:tetratricopeptide (TPR) repeat protein